MTPAELLTESIAINGLYEELLGSIEHTSLKNVYLKWSRIGDMYPTSSVTNLFRMEAILELLWQVETLKMQQEYVSEN